ncbi:hypothetical protein BTO04_01820 [Polaribacter sp. SA4-10]|uniref:hypothetical protein n=1 Tax=Polaribacter sp. SA4-10 TaxID=754397 RepID=UPI000B3C42EB|nr:hypothetical protein [Polaribacter sp. SA4-10]ARV05508.1 hypothetical protein BTO04_01820 [Polaribacter sp. SA4-10]
MKKLGLVITDGVGYRNFILSNFLNEASYSFNKIIIFSCIPKNIYPKLPDNILIIELNVFEEGFVTWSLKKVKEVIHLRMFAKSNFGVNDNLKSNYSKGRSNRARMVRFIYWLTRFIAKEKYVLLFNKLQQLTFKNKLIVKDYLKILKNNRVDILFFTHQRPSFIAPIIYASEKLKIKTGTFIFSWDNLASKGRMAGNFNNYFVWNDLMREELLYFYKSIKKEKIHVVGTPQFEPYVMTSFGYDNIEFCKKFNLNTNYKTILFTCNDSSSENDPLYLEILAEAIKKDKLVSGVNLIVRTSPAEGAERFKELILKYDFIKWNFPDWKLARSHCELWTQRVPSITDLSDLKSLLMYSDLVINVLSTITLDSFIFDKPVINPVFGNENNTLFDDQKFLKYLHLERLVESNSSIIVKNEKEYIESINYILLGKDDKIEERKAFLKLQTLLPLKDTSKRFVKAFHSISKELNTK